MVFEGAFSLGGFSINVDILFSSSNTATPYLEGSSTSVNTIVAIPPFFLWKLSTSR